MGDERATPAIGHAWRTTCINRRVRAFQPLERLVWRMVIAKGQQKKSKEARKPKAEKPPKQNASNPSTKGQPVGMVDIKS